MKYKFTTMEIKQDFQNRSVSIEKLYTWYKEEKLLVNRRYQRKLVWTIAEKQALIESIANFFPMPLIMVAEVKYNGLDVYEIIDGMQRLEAIFSFIENRITYNGGYFNLEAIGLTKQLKDSQKISQQPPILNVGFCQQLTSYEVPLLVYKAEKENAIDEVFKRINYFGRHLSDQELRQAGLNKRFGYLVRKIAEKVRGDETHADQLLLNNMAKVSIGNNRLGYGIDIRDIYWHKHAIVTDDNIRKSRDEELIAYLLANMILQPSIDATSKNLDRIYDGDFGIEEEIQKIGEDAIEKYFDIVFAEINKTLGNDKFCELLFRQDTKYLNRSYQVVFLSFYDLIIREQLIVANYERLHALLEGVGDRNLTHLTETLNIASVREETISAFKGIIGKAFRPREIADPALDNGIMKLESILNRSKTENNNYDFKIGFNSLASSPTSFSDDTFNRIMQTLVAMANISNGSVGYVIVGVADKEADKSRYEQIYGDNTAKRVGSFWVTGIQKEAILNKGNHDKYLMWLKQKIQNSPITPVCYIQDILSKIDFFTYFDKEILILKIQNNGKDVAKYNGSIYQRQGTSTEIVDPVNEADIWRRILT